MESSRRARNRAACRRCQRRKIRCDGNTPVCGACQKAGVDCVNDGTQEVHRSYISQMENRIKWLESMIAEKRPDIDLENATYEPALHVVEDSFQNNPPRLPPIPDGPRLPDSENRPPEEPQPAHEMGFVSLFRGEDPRYIGPSSGYFFAKRILSNTGSGPYGRNVSAAATTGKATQFPVELVNIPATLPQKEIAVELSSKYFQTIHQLYPFLHEQAHMKTIDEVYKQDDDPIGSFQVYMVLAIASLNLSRRYKQQLPVESYYTSAMKNIDYICHHGSMAALQCLLLLMVYALYNPSCKINIWNLNYQCLASVIDLGLQRDVRASSNYPMSQFKQEMRTRVFWVVYTFDRILCTMMGRPIGIRDEACEMRLPLDIADLDLMNATTSQPPTSASHMSLAIRLFKLAKLNSEIKYVMHSINRDVPSYAFPPVKDIYTWQQDMIRTLEGWYYYIPQQAEHRESGMTQYFNAKYHEIMILLLRPSPAIPDLAEETFGLCLDHAFSLLRCFGELYETQNLLYSRIVVHSIFLGTLVILHCIWKFPRTAEAKFSVDQIITKFNTSQNILSSIGEHWVEAVRARDCIARLSNVTIQRLLKKQPATLQSTQSTMASLQEHTMKIGQPPVTPSSNVQGHAFSETNELNSTGPWPSLTASSDDWNLCDDILQTDFEGLGGLADIDALISDLLNSSH